MHEFNNRIAVQRHILQLVNRKPWDREALFGLSSKAIDRWMAINRIDPNARLPQLVRTASSKLFFLANKSQEQVTEEYMTKCDEIADISDEIDAEVG